MKTRFNSLVKIVATLSLAGITFTQAADQYWNPSPLSGNWANAVWSATSGGGSLTTWSAANSAIFEQTGAYTATINADQTATNISIKAGAVTFAGTNTLSATNITIDSGATLSGAGDRYLKSGTTTLTVNGTLDYTALASTARRVSIAGGNGSIILGAGLRIGGNITFAGNISGGSAGALVTDAGGIIDLSGNNTYAGDTLIRSSNTLRLGSTTALSANTFLRFGGGTNIVELTGTNFSRTVGSTAGTVRFNAGADGAGNSGFAAVNADRTVALNGTVSWAAGLFNPTIFLLGTAASTHKVTLTTDINLNAGTRTINAANGSAAIEAEISGVLTGAAGSNLTKTGDGVLLLSNANNYLGITTISGGVLGLGNGGTTGSLSASGTIVNNANLTINRSNDVVQGTDFSSTAITGSGSFTQAGAGTTTFTVANSYAGATDVQNGTLQLNAALAATTALNLGNGSNSGKVILGNAAALTQTVAGLTTTGSGTTNSIVGSAAANSTLTVNLVSGSNIFGGVLGGGGTNENNLAIVKSGAGTLTLANANTYTGGTTVTAGTLALGSAGALSATGTITMNGGGLIFSAANTTDYSSRLLLADGKAATFNTNGQSVTFASAFQYQTLNTASLVKTGSGTLTLTPNTTASLAGMNTSGGTLEITSGSYTVTGNAGTGAPDSTTGFVVSKGGTFRLNGGNVTATSGTYLFTAGNTGGGSSNFILDSGTFNGGNLEVLNAYGANGTTTINSGTLTAGQFRVSQATGILNLNGGILRVNNLSTGGGTSTINFNGGTVEAKQDNSNFLPTSITNAKIRADGAVFDTSTFNITVAKDLTEDATSTGGGLTKQGSGALTLEGANTYTGVTTINAGTISIAALGDGGAAGNLGAAPVAASNLVFGGGTLQISAAGAASSNRGFTINAASSATFNVSNAAGDLTMTGSVPTTTGVLYKTGGGTMTLDPGVVSQSLGAISANGGELILKSGTYATTAKDATQAAYNIGAGARGGTLTIDGATLNVGGGNNLKIAAAANGNLSIKSGTVTSTELVVGHNGTGVATQTGGTVTVDNLYHQDGNGGNSYTLTGGSLTAKRIYNNTATAVDFSLNLNGGTLKSASGTSNLIDNNNIGTQIAVLLGTGDTIIDTTASSATIVRPMGDMPSVAGTFTKAGTNTLTLTAASTYTGGTTVAAGTLLVNNTTDSGTGSGAVNVTGTALGSIVATLGGTGTIDGAVTIGALGTLSPTAQASGSKLTLGSTLAFDSGGTSIFNWDLSAADTPDPGAVANNGNYGQAAVTGAASGTAVFNIALLGGAGKTTSYADAFWDTNKTWNDLFASSGMTDLSNLFTSFTGTGLTPSGSGATAIATAGDRGYFSFNGSTTLTWTAVPEPTSALAGILLGFGMLRRRR